MLKHVFTDRFGYRYYELQETSQLNYARSIAAETAARQADYCMTRETLLDMIRQMKTHANEGDITKLFYMLQEMEERTHYAAEEETLYRLASVYYFEELEDVNVYNTLQQEEKINRWRRDPKASAFFLSKAFGLIRSLENISEQDILTYLATVKRKNEAMRRVYSGPSSDTSTK